MKSRDLALVAILLAIGTVLYAFVPNFGAVTPDLIVAFVVLAILLVRPKPLEGLGIGIVSGLLSMFFSKSSIAWFNIPAHAAGGFVVALAAYRMGELKTGKFSWKPVVGTFIHVLVSGGIFITGLLVAGIFPFQVYITVAWVQVLLTGVVDTIINLILYQPAKALYERYSAPRERTKQP